MISTLKYDILLLFFSPSKSTSKYRFLAYPSFLLHPVIDNRLRSLKAIENNTIELLQTVPNVSTYVREGMSSV